MFTQITCELKITRDLTDQLKVETIMAHGLQQSNSERNINLVIIVEKQSH